MNSIVDKANFVEKIMLHLKSDGLIPNEDAMNHQIYTLRHKLAFVSVQGELTGTVTKSGILHDTDKLVLYGLYGDIEKSSKLHRKYSRHHIGNLETEKDREDCIIDFECARLTKPDKPLNAYNTIMKYKQSEFNSLKGTLIRFGICSPDNIELKNISIEKELGNSLIEANVHEILKLQIMIKSLGVDNALKMYNKECIQ